jgi:hypothetical protein
VFGACWPRSAFPLGKAAASINRAVSVAVALLAAALAVTRPVYGHGIAGNRLFPGTLAFDDPAAADELVLPNFSSFEHPVDDRNVRDNRFNWAFSRLLTPTIALGIENGWLHRNWGGLGRSGFESTDLTLKAEVYRNDLHETLVAASVTWGIGGSGAKGVGANAPDTIEPGIFFGKGLGDLPDQLAWLRPFGLTGAIVAEHPLRATSTNLAPDPVTGALGPVTTSAVDRLHWGFSIQYSTLYLTDRFTPGRLPKSEPVHQFVPLVEFDFDSARGQKTAATMNPGLAYVSGTWQIALEAIVPINSEAGHGVGGRAQLLLFLDDLAPSLFGKPLLTR